MAMNSKRTTKIYLFVDQLQDFIQLLVLLLDVVHTLVEYNLVLGVTIVIIYCLIELETLLVDLVHVVA